jgi:hypothetical protein
VLGAEGHDAKNARRVDGVLTGRPISTSSPVSEAASTNMAAGRACRPTDEAMVTVRPAMMAPFVGGLSTGELLIERGRARCLSEGAEQESRMDGGPKALSAEPSGETVRGNHRFRTAAA